MSTFLNLRLCSSSATASSPVFDSGFHFKLPKNSCFVLEVLLVGLDLIFGHALKSFDLGGLSSLFCCFFLLPFLLYEVLAGLYDPVQGLIHLRDFRAHTNQFSNLPLQELPSDLGVLQQLLDLEDLHVVKLVILGIEDLIAFVLL